MYLLSYAVVCMYMYLLSQGFVYLIVDLKPMWN